MVKKIEERDYRKNRNKIRRAIRNEEDLWENDRCGW
jgi:hypothetical protein